MRSHWNRSSTIEHNGLGHAYPRNATSEGIIFFEIVARCSKTNQSKHEYNKEAFDETVKLLDLCIHFLAFCGNLTSLIVLARRNIMGARMTQLLCLLTFSEVLYTGLSFTAEVIEHIAHEEMSIYLEILCKVCSHSFLSQRNWWIVVIGCVRYLVITRPLKMKRSHLYTKKSLYIVFGLLLTSWLIESIGLTCLFRVLVEKCNDTGRIKVKVWALHDTKNFYRIAEGIAVFIRTFLPTILVSIFSFLTLRKLYWSSSVSQRKLSAATRTIFLLTLIFALFELPYGISFIFCLLPEKLTNYNVFLYYSAVSQILVALDSMCNMIVYCVSSPIYRANLLSCLHLNRCCSGRESSCTTSKTETYLKSEDPRRSESDFGEDALVTKHMRTGVGDEEETMEMIQTNSAFSTSKTYSV